MRDFLDPPNSRAIEELLRSNQFHYPDGWDEDDEQSTDIPIPDILSESIPGI